MEFRKMLLAKLEDVEEDVRRKESMLRTDHGLGRAFPIYVQRARRACRKRDALKILLSIEGEDKIDVSKGLFVLNMEQSSRLISELQSKIELIKTKTYERNGIVEISRDIYEAIDKVRELEKFLGEIHIYEVDKYYRDRPR
ncbi:hypothetical protein Barb4_01123 [Bacteroidales bacterium Barb4]|nr:hypothetical protein Barb4_01123 [Bacteroidales bacterium Barb4]